MRKILEQPFAEADTKDIPCILDTDTPLKVKKIYSMWNGTMWREKIEKWHFTVYDGV